MAGGRDARLPQQPRGDQAGVGRLRRPFCFCMALLAGLWALSRSRKPAEGGFGPRGASPAAVDEGASRLEQVGQVEAQPARRQPDVSRICAARVPRTAATIPRLFVVNPNTSADFTRKRRAATAAASRRRHDVVGSSSQGPSSIESVRGAVERGADARAHPRRRDARATAIVVACFSDHPRAAARGFGASALWSVCSTRRSSQRCRSVTASRSSRQPHRAPAAPRGRGNPSVARPRDFASVAARSMRRCSHSRKRRRRRGRGCTHLRGEPASGRGRRRGGRRARLRGHGRTLPMAACAGTRLCRRRAGKRGGRARGVTRTSTAHGQRSTRYMRRQRTTLLARALRPGAIRHWRSPATHALWCGYRKYASDAPLSDWLRHAS